MPLDNDFAKSLVSGYDEWKQQQPQQQSEPQPDPGKSWIETAKDDLVNTVSNYIEGAKQGYAEYQRADENLRSYLPEGGVVSTPEQAAALNTPEFTQAAQWQNQASNNFLEETAKPVAMPAALVSPTAGIAAIPFMVSDAAKAYDEGGAGKVARDFTYGGAVDFATQPDLAQQFQDRPISTIANGAMSIIPAALLGRGVYKGAKAIPEFKNELAAAVDSKMQESLGLLDEMQPIKATQGLDTLDQYDSPTRGFRPAYPDEMKQWNADQQVARQAEIQGEAEALGRIRNNQYGMVFDQEPQSRFSDTALADVPQQAQGKAVSPLVDILNHAAAEKWDKATGDSWQNHINIAADNAMLSPAERLMSGADIAERKPYNSGQGIILGEKPQAKELYIPDEYRPRPQPDPQPQQPFKLATAEDLISETNKRILDGRLRNSVNTRDHAAVQDVITTMQKEGFETPLSRAVLSKNVEYSRSANQQAGKQPAAESMQPDMLNKAHQAGMSGDYATAYTLAKQAGNADWAKAYKSMMDTNGGQAPPVPNLTGKVKGEYTDSNITKRNFLQRTSELFAPIRTGRIGKAGVEGFVNHNTGIIRTRNYGDMDVAAHEVGHVVDAALKLRGNMGAYDSEFVRAVHDRFGKQAYEPEQVRAEGIAEFMRDYVMHPEQAKKTFPSYYSAFERALAENPDVHSRVNEFKDMARAWNEQSPEARGRGGVSYSYENKPNVIQRGKDAWQKTQEYWIDDKVGLARVTAEYERITGEKLATENDPYKMARLAQNSAVARAQMLIDGKNPELVKQVLNESYGGSIDAPVTMKSILSHLDSLSKKYPDYLKQGNFKDWHEALDTLLVARRQVELQNIHPEYKGPISRADAEVVIRNAPAELQKAAQDFYNYNNNILRILANEGLIKPEVYEALTAKYKNYAPMARDFTDESAMAEGFGMGTGFGNVRNALKSISEEGSARQVISPLESTVKNTYAMLNLVERNNVGKIFTRLAESEKVGKLVEEVSGTAAQKDSVFSVWKNGEKRHYQTTPEIYRAIMSLNKDTANAITKLLAPPASIMRAGATLTPDFALKNIMRDTFSAAVFSRYGFRPVIDHAAGVFHMLKKDKLFHEYQASGALQSTLVGLDRDYTQASIKGLYKKNAKYYWNNYNPVQLLRGFSEALETATRLGEYGRAKSKGASVADAALSARDVTLDFSKHGVYGKTANKIVAFFNAAVQEPVRIAQAFAENPRATSAKIGLYITTPSILLWAMNHDQDWYKELPSYQKNLFWVFKGGETIYRIPKPFGLGVLFGSLPERILDWQYNQDPKGMSKWAANFADSMTPNFIPTAMAPLLEWQANYSFFMGRNIVPAREEKLPNNMQYGPDTSELAKYIGGKFDASPRKVDAMIHGYGAGLARQTLNGVDALAGKRDFKNPLSTFTADPYKSPQSIQDYYEKLNDLQAKHNASNMTKAPLGRIDKVNYDKMLKANKAMQQLNKVERETLRSNMLSEQKNAKVSAINKQQAQLAQAVLKQLK
ncbi:hypothetical protein SPSIL_015270 [Sporomusa silvacetica DSM 10669]|uniref:Large polyvalent protein associated domain-containing protein n=1 Tax=Sporomusa silvacetica DSM 10669 TaxID=1123289 RepID=A0ABZ3IIA3_9FIRM|nr:LPD38 domain-containing protein [Sporomusa silvacetica]OZC21589.1 hypothetical protein SPSIL_10000 [Sporomusa silvacetica DSM 10669]